MKNTVSVRDADEDTRQSYKAKLPLGTILAVGIVAVIVGGVGGILVGYQIGNTNDIDDGQRAGLNGDLGGGMMGGGQFGPGGFGTVSKVDSGSITVEDQRQGEETTYSITTDTTITDNDESASISDIKVGDMVMIQSDDDSDADTKTATSIQLNPSFGGGPGARTQSSRFHKQSSNDTNI